MKHLPHYVSLIAIFLAGLVGFYVFSYDKYFRVSKKYHVHDEKGEAKVGDKVKILDYTH